MAGGTNTRGTVVRLSNGSWEARIEYVHPVTTEPERQSFYCKTEAAAQAKLAAARSQLASGMPPADADDLSAREWVVPVVKGLASYVPGLYTVRSRRRHQQIANARYCYDVWMRHMVLLAQWKGTPVPRTLAELGPGGSLGVGIAAILSGATTYYALDIVEYSDVDQNLALLDEIADLFRQRAPVNMGWLSDEHHFPHHLFSDSVIAANVAASRIEEIRRALTSRADSSDQIEIAYITPWNDPAVVRRHEVDLIISHSVLEHVNDLPDTYDAFAQWLKPGGHMSHMIDFSSHGLTRTWNGHWRYPDFVWKLIVGKKPYLINRQPYSVHYNHITSRGMRVVHDRYHRVVGLPRKHLAPQWRNLSDRDLVCASALVQAEAPAEIGE